MSTREFFFRKIFQKNDEVESYYKNKSFENFSEQEKVFLKRLTIFSKYKAFMRNKLTMISESKLTRKRQYIDINSGNLNYQEFIDFERAKEELKDEVDNLVTTWLIMGVLSGLVVIYRTPQGKSALPMTINLLLLNTLGCYAYFQNQKNKKYKPVINEVYSNLANRLNNSKYLKLGGVNEDSKKNFFNNLDFSQESYKDNLREIYDGK